MSDSEAPLALPEHALCPACNYSLRGLDGSARRCPECGCPFDPADPKTMYFGRPLGRVGRFLIRPVGWTWVLLMVGAAIATLAATGIPSFHLRPSLIDLFYFFPVDAWRDRRLVLPSDYAYAISLWASALALAGFLLSAFVRVELIYVKHLLPIQVKPQRRRLLLFAIATLVLCATIVFGWPERVGRNIAAKHLWRENLSGRGIPTGSSVEIRLDTAEMQETLRGAMQRGRTPALRLAAVHLIHLTGAEASLTLLDGLDHETDPRVRAARLHLAGLVNDPEAIAERVLLSTHDSDSEVRAAVADTLCLFGGANFLIPSSGWGWSTQKLLCNMPGISAAGIDINGPRDIDGDGIADNFVSIPMPAAKWSARIRSRLLEMLRSATADPREREAAARGLVSWPPADPHLRVAEWGVWIDDGGGELKLVQSVLDEIPSFVHRTGNPLASMGDRINPIMIVTKPVIHLTSPELIAVDLDVQIRLGRPWFAYPKPNDFNVSVVRAQRGLNADLTEAALPTHPLQRFEHTDIFPLDNAREGFPWLTPTHRKSGSDGGIGNPYNEINAIGLHWQSAIVSPTQLPGTTLANIGNDPRFQWWSRLRDVGTSWVSSKGESERFLYYDGPTDATTPVVVTRNGDRLSFEVRGFPPDWDGIWDLSVDSDISHDPSDQAKERAIEFYRKRNFLSGNSTFKGIAQRAPDRFRRRGLYVHPTGGRLCAAAVEVPYEDGSISVVSLTDVDAATGGPKLLQSMLTDAGLTAAEASGMVDCWRKQFFETSGTRFLLLMAPSDYDTLCPIKIRPAPAEMSRVGIVLTEFKN